MRTFFPHNSLVNLSASKPTQISAWILTAFVALWSFDLSWSLIFDLLIWVDLWSLISWSETFWVDLWSLISWSELTFELWSLDLLWSFLDLWSSSFLTFWFLIVSWSDLLVFDLWTLKFMISWTKFKINRGCYATFFLLERRAKFFTSTGILTSKKPKAQGKTTKNERTLRFSLCFLILCTVFAIFFYYVCLFSNITVCRCLCA